ncbi:MAG: hypothetical protein GY750_20760 [Lentisphaerae bacterium]|nr:hypothetical protein [Lentisphaerota bacterium]MCP4103823.1 hypothetical protein [Lentisphaerota bacterium]
MKLRIFIYICTVGILLPLTGCVGGTTAPQMTPLQIQLMQTKIFNVKKRVAFDSVVTVFQNLGYIVTSANYDTGFITAESPKKTNFWGVTKYNSSTAFITDLKPGKTSIRINFVNHSIFYSGGQSGGKRVDDEAVLDAQAYVNAFSKLQQQIFVTTGISPVESQPVQTQLDTIKANTPKTK